MPRTILLAAGAAIAALAAGCTSSADGTAVPQTTSGTSSTPPSTTSSTKAVSDRPREIKLDGKDPCGLITQQQWAQFFIEKPGKPGTSGAYRAPECFYGTNVGFFNIVLVNSEGIDVWTSGTRPVQIQTVPPIAQFPAAAITTSRDPQSCDVAVDVAQGQHLLATVSVTPSKESKVPPKCDFAHQLAEAAMVTLVASS